MKTNFEPTPKAITQSIGAAVQKAFVVPIANGAAAVGEASSQAIVKAIGAVVAVALRRYFLYLTGALLVGVPAVGLAGLGIEHLSLRGAQALNNTTCDEGYKKTALKVGKWALVSIAVTAAAISTAFLALGGRNWAMFLSGQFLFDFQNKTSLISLAGCGGLSLMYQWKVFQSFMKA